MAWRIVQITSACKLSVKNQQLLYEPKSGEKVTLPLEDIAVVILESKHILITSTLLSELAEYGVCLFSCDGTHTPNGVYTAFGNHSRHSEVANLQIEASEPLKKRLWQKIVKAKIRNQAEVLRRIGNRFCAKLDEIAKNVQSGDTTNGEAFAAGLYWDNLFENFKRHDADITNAALNYGYAIVRGAIARSLVGAGLLPCFGLHHANKLNAFNLADDIIEPFRAFVDWAVVKSNLGEKDRLENQDKQLLVSVLTRNCSYDDEETTILKAVEQTAYSLVNAFKDKEAKSLILPEFSKTPLFE